MHDLVTAWRRALVGEVCWLGPGERPEGTPATPLALDGVPCLALPYAGRETAHAVAAAPEVVFAVTDARSLASGGPGVAAVGTTTVHDDLDGKLFTEHLLEQELLKYPPSRTLADSLLLRRENWWWLPRLIVRLDHIDRTVSLPARSEPACEALLVHDGTGLRLDTVRFEDGEGHARPRSLAGDPLRGDGAPALLFGHDYTEPDLERWEPWTVRGRLLGDELTVEERDGEPGAALPPLRLLDRVRRQRELGRACRRGVAAAERVRGH